MEELLGKYYKLIINHFAKYVNLERLYNSNDWKTAVLLHQILTFNDKLIERQKIIENHEDILFLKTRYEFRFNIICLLLEIYLGDFFELKKTIRNLKSQKISHKDEIYLNLLDGLIETQNTDSKKVLVAFNNLLQIIPEDYEKIRLLWDQYYNGRNHNILLEITKLLDHNDLFNNEILHFKGFLLKEMGRYAEALYIYDNILNFKIKMEKDLIEIAWSYFFLADCFFSLGNMPMSINSCNHSLRKINDNADATDLLILVYNLRGEALINQKKKDRALKDIEVVLGFDQNNVNAKILLNQINQ